MTDWTWYAAVAALLLAGAFWVLIGAEWFTDWRLRRALPDNIRLDNCQTCAKKKVLVLTGDRVWLCAECRYGSD